MFKRGMMHTLCSSKLLLLECVFFFEFVDSAEGYVDGRKMACDLTGRLTS